MYIYVCICVCVKFQLVINNIPDKSSVLDTGFSFSQKTNCSAEFEKESLYNCLHVIIVWGKKLFSYSISLFYFTRNYFQFSGRKRWVFGTYIMLKKNVHTFIIFQQY